MSTANRGDLIWISIVLDFFIKQGTFLRIFLCQSHDIRFGYVSTKNEKCNIFNAFLNSKFISTHLLGGGELIRIYMFVFSHQNHSEVSFFLNFGVFKEDKRTHPKRNE